MEPEGSLPYSQAPAIYNAGLYKIVQYVKLLNT